jgi:long-chain acyl-CoA synthetase
VISKPPSREEVQSAMQVGMSVALWAQRLPDAPALIAGNVTRTFRELNSRCNQLVRSLRARGVVAGDGIALMCDNTCEFVEVMWATRRAGLRLTPINWHLTAQEAAYIVVDCDAKVVFAQARFAEVAQQLRQAIPATTLCVALDGVLPGFLPYQSLWCDQDDTDITDPIVGSSMLYTSGTTGRPKGVYRTSPVPPVTALTAAASYEAGRSRHLCTGPLYHAAPLAYSLWMPHSLGVPVILMERWDAERALQLIQQHGVTHTHMVPTMLHRLLSLPDEVRNRYAVASLQFLLHGAAPCPIAVKRALIDWLGPIVYEYYAATEGTATWVDSAEWLQRPGTVGRPESIDKVRIIDAEGELAAPGEVGTVYLRAPDSGRFEYYKDRAKTAQAYHGDYYTLGDMGYLDRDGYLFLTDRSAHLIISGGVNIYPAEIEATLLLHPAVDDVGVIGVPDAEWGETVKAVVVVHAGYTASEQLATELIDHCKKHLARFKAPRSVAFVATLPRSDSGKLYKQQLRERYRDK